MLRSGEITIYDECCNRCGVKNKRDGGVQCELLSGDDSVQSAQSPPETADKYVLTDDPYCEDITEASEDSVKLRAFARVQTPARNVFFGISRLLRL